MLRGGVTNNIFNPQWATKVVEKLLGNDALRYLSTYSILFAFSVNSLIPPPRSTNQMLCRRCSLCSPRNRKFNIVWQWGEEGGKCVQDARKSNFTAKCLNTFVAHCSLQWRLMRDNIIKREVIGFGFTSDWMKKWRDFVLRQSCSVVMYNQLLFDTQMKTAPNRESNVHD